MNKKNNVPNKLGYFGNYGGQFVPETLMPALKELENKYSHITALPDFKEELKHYLVKYAGRETPLYFAEQLTKNLRGAKIYLKREDLLHTGAHKINNTLGQVLLAKKMGKTRIIAETGAGQHGVATATACALFGLQCEVYMGSEDVRRQAINVAKMKLLGARVISVTSGANTLKDAMNEAIRDWVTNVKNTFYVIGSVAGPHPYPQIVREFQSVIGKEAKRQILKDNGRLPSLLIACVGGGSNAMGLFHAFRHETSVRLVGVEAAGLGLSTDKHAATLTKGSQGILHGSKSYILQDSDGQIVLPHSISAGLDYPGVGPEHAYLKDNKRASYATITDKEALAGFQYLSKIEGIIPALETSHAIAHTMKVAKKMKKTESIIVCLSGRGDKDMDMAMGYLKL